MNGRTVLGFGVAGVTVVVVVWGLTLIVLDGLGAIVELVLFVALITLASWGWRQVGDWFADRRWEAGRALREQRFDDAMAEERAKAAGRGITYTDEDWARLVRNPWRAQ